MPDSILDGLRYEHRESQWAGILGGRADGEFVFVAETMGEVCGFASGGRERSGNPDYQGELFAIYVLQFAQKLGAGRLLFDAVAQRLLKEGYDSMLVWVLERNPACGFYEAMGGNRVGQKDERFGDVVLSEVAYGWRYIS